VECRPRTAGRTHQSRQRIHIYGYVLALVGATFYPASGMLAETRPPVSFDRDVRPILSDKCYHCHGPDAESRQADLRLDTRAGLLDYAVVPGKPDDSEVIARVFSTDPELRMPPVDSKLTLTEAEKNILRRWIEDGAPFAEHWSFQELPANVPVPDTADHTWSHDTLDHFVLARLEQENLKPSPEAAPLRLLRRMTFDLTGLPPTAAECRDFEQSVAEHGVDTALAQAADRLLASPAYGEHMAVAWLDAARYADSYGYQSDQLNTQWPFREPLQTGQASTKGLLLGSLFSLLVVGAGWVLFDRVLDESAIFGKASALIHEKVKGFGIDSGGKYVLLAAFYSLFHSLLEEYYWRWFVFRQLRGLTPLWPAIIVSSLGFMSHHVIVLLVFFQGAPLLAWLLSAAVAVGGAFWAWLYNRTDSLFGPWLSHLLIDAGIFWIGYDLIHASIAH